MLSLSSRITGQQQRSLTTILLLRRRHFASASTSSSNTTPTKRRLDVAIVGAPNAGKSQLLNQWTQSTVAAVSRKRHTTRDVGILGARTLENTQLVFWDTPGYMRQNSARRDGVDRNVIVNDAEGLVEAVDYSLIVVDAARKLSGDDYKESIVSLMVTALQAEGREEAIVLEEDDFELEQPVEKFGIVLNKVDLVTPKTDLLFLAEELGTLAETTIEHYLNNDNNNNNDVSLEDLFPSIFYTDAKKGEGTEDVLTHLAENLATPAHVWAVDADEVTNLSLTDRLEEIVREKIYRVLHKELPHSVFQVHRGMDERNSGVVEVHQDLCVKSKSHYSIIAGRNLSTIQQMAQRDLQKIFPNNVKVILHLHLRRYKGQQHDQLSHAAMVGTTTTKFVR